MKQREKRNIIIGILCCMVVFMSVGYAVLSQNLKINGTANITGSWDIYIESITFNTTESSATTSGTGSVDQADKTKATYNAELLKPQDVVVYDVVVANGGTIDAVLNDLVIDPTDTEYFTFETIGIAKGDELPAQTGDNPTTRSFKIKITFKDSVTEANMPASGTQVEGLVKLDYVQKGNFETEGLPGGDDQIPVESSPFKVTKDGTLVYYERQGDETSVKVPAEVNGTKIKAISIFAFIDNANLALDGQNGIVVDLNEEFDESILNIAELEGMQYAQWNEYSNRTDLNLDVLDRATQPLFVDPITKSEMDYLIDDAANYYLTELDLSEAIYLETIGQYAFYIDDELDGVEMSRLNKVIFPTNGVLTTIGGNAFGGNNISGELVLPSSVINIKRNAFGGNDLTKIIIKRATEEGMTLESGWNGNAEVIFDPNYVG